jgi:two-component system, cell cycle sensor histidine kinase and response regulator CckA
LRSFFVSLRVFLAADRAAGPEMTQVHGSLDSMNAASILFVDDEPVLRELMKTSLETEGFDVITASDGLNGLQRYEENKDKVQVVVTDIDMPAMNGSDMVRQIFEISPEMKVIVASGRKNLGQETASGPLRAVSRLQKPYTPRELSSALRVLLT